MKKMHFALEVYMRKMFKIIVLGIPFIAVFAGATFLIMKSCNLYPDVSWTPLIIFVCTTIIYLAFGIYFCLKCDDKEKMLKPKYIVYGKIFISILIVIQWNFISYVIPSRDFWAYFILFIFVSIFFLDSKYVLHTIGIVILSMIISWIIKPDVLLPKMPVDNGTFIPELILRIILIIFICTLFYTITRIIEKQLVGELEKIAEYDTLTLLRNRRMLNSYGTKYIDSFKNKGTQFCFIMSDIDDFKKVNDAYGHPFGDVVLKNIAKLFIHDLGSVGNIFRYGGEEICILLPLPLKEATELTDKLRKKIESLEHKQGNINVKVTMSFGIAEYKDGLSFEDLIKISDANLYYAKAHGKNVVIS